MLAILITAAGALIAFGHGSDTPPPEHVVAMTVVLERPAPTPAPTAPPTPRPTLTPQPVVLATAAPVQRAAPRVAHRAGGGAREAPRAMPHHPAVPIVAALPATAGVHGDAPLPGTGSGAGTGADAGAGTGAAGGSGTAGSGTVDADVPCGYVEFIPSEAPRVAGSVSYERIRATVHYPDGREASEDFPYPWVYADYMQTDPWSPINVRKKDLVVFAQLPPPGADVARYSAIVRYVLDHTNPNGSTVLQPCPH